MEKDKFDESINRMIRYAAKVMEDAHRRMIQLDNHDTLMERVLDKSVSNIYREISFEEMFERAKN